MDFDAKMEERLSAVERGRLENGLSYYVRCYSQPKLEAKLALAVNVGILIHDNSILEEENELGVAHMVEHLAFGATKKYHDVIKFLKGIGENFHTCQDASTTAEETIYELAVPTDKPELLSQAILVLAEFSSEIRILAEDLEKERGPIIQEYHDGRDASGRIRDENWHLMLEGSKYADRSPISTLKTIHGVSYETVKKFYTKWYALRHMALIVVGDFPDTKVIKYKCLPTSFWRQGFKKRKRDSRRFPLRCCSFVAESAIWRIWLNRTAISGRSFAAESSWVKISFKSSVNEVNTIASYRKSLVAIMFCLAMRRRFTKGSQKNDPPYHSCTLYPDDHCRAIKALTMKANCIENGTIARVRLHGFSKQEISIQRRKMLSFAESARYEVTSSIIEKQYVQHFLCQEPVFNVEDKVDLRRTIIPDISASEVSGYSQGLSTTNNCVIMVVEPQDGTTMDDIKTTMLSVNSLEGVGNISPWEDEDIREEIVTSEPNLGNAFGGLSEVPENDYMSCLYGETIAKRIGLFGFKPSVLADMLDGKDVRADTGVGHYMRSFSGSCSSTHLKTALQDVEVLMQLLEEKIEAEGRNPGRTFLKHVDEVKYGNCYFSRVSLIVGY
ncbi:hypothetical protein OSB04_019418 [Centaurea solstitialis]|uniref:Peptidase M16 N-terminal domain-containing protein n=1 Tax=Centaurea solstitialis TaxID=347529 RepID=A0AA38WCD4_9ASTR|nr:hypothetical protein OSB04_019418 [Centaurea solstitialis]